MGRTNYPGTLDSDLELPRVENNVTEVGADAINSLRDAIFSIEEAIGLNPQGNLSDFVSRVNEVIDADGNIKTSALSELGLITLPIYNNQIGESAGIEESKLNLEFSTSALNALISSANSNIDALTDSINRLFSNTTSHYSGTSFRHDGYNIDLDTSFRSVSDVETALHTINNVLTAHLDDTIGAHAASEISVLDEFQNISATDAQGALVELDNKILAGNLESHQDLLHINAISLNAGGEQGAQGNLKETTFASTIYQTDTSEATNILQVMRPDVARVTSKSINLNSVIVGQSNNLRVQAGGIGRTYLDIDLTSIIPISNLDDLIDKINSVAHSSTNHYPISAYNTGGKLTIAHHIPGQEFTIQILDTVTYSAASALGFGDVVSTQYTWPGENHSAYVGGKRVKRIRSYIKTHYTHSAISSTISLGLGDLSLYDLSTNNTGKILCNITNHSTTDTDNGTYYITSFPTSSTFTINATIQNGTFDLEIAADSTNFQNSTRGELYDVFLDAYGDDGYGAIAVSNRISYGTINGANLKSISENFPTSNMAWQINGSDSIMLFEGSEVGPTTAIPTGFTGTLEVFAPDGVNSALFEITSAPASAKRTIDEINAFAGSNSRLYLSSVHYAGNYGINTLKFVTDKRQMGGGIENQSEDILVPTKIEESLKELRNNGVIRGLDVASFDSDSIKVRGGKALVDGRIVEVETQEIQVVNFNAATQLLLLDKSGKFSIKNEFDGGYSFSELTSGDSYGDIRNVAIIAQFETDGSEIDGYVLDRRLMVSNIDKRLIDAEADLHNKIDDVKRTVNGSMWGFTVASTESGADGYLAGIEVSSNDSLTYIPSEVGWWDEDEYAAYGFIGGRSMITTRTFEFNDSNLTATSIFRAPGLTHINVFMEVIYSGESGGPFGVSDTVYLEIGVATQVGISTITTTSDFARVRTISAGVFPSNTVTERYVASIPVSQLSLSDNVLFDITPRVRIVNSNYVDGGSGDDLTPSMEFDYIRIVTSSYSIAGQINDQDGSSAALGAVIGEVL